MTILNLIALQAFLRDEFSEENAIFWQKCEEYRQSTNTAYRKQLARLIYVDHVAESSTDQVNIDAYVRQTIERRLSTASVNLFDDAQRQVYLLMKYDSYPRFLRSRLFCDAVDAERLNKRLEVPESSTDTTGKRQVGGSLLSKLRMKWKGVKSSRLTAKDDSGHGSSLSSFGSDSGEHSRHSGSSVEETPAAVTPASLFNRLLRRRSASRSTHRDCNESSTAAATPSTAPTARRSLFFNRWKRSTDVDDDARSVSTVASTRTTTDSPHRSRPRRTRSSDSRRRLSVPLSHVVRCDAEERRRFAAVMARLAAAGGEGLAPAPVHSDTDERCRRVDRQHLHVGDRLRSVLTNEMCRRRRRRRESTDNTVEFTVYFV